MRARTSRDAWEAEAAADPSFRSLLRRRDTILATLRRRGVDFRHGHQPPVDGRLNAETSSAVTGHTSEPAPQPNPAVGLAGERTVDSTGDLTPSLAPKVENLERALLTRAVIGQATGILMERRKVTAEEAFRTLRTVSNVTNRKLRDIAADLVETGELPGPSRPAR